MSTLLTDFASMTTPFSGNFNKSNSKRPRSQDSQRSLTPAPALKASKIEEAQDSASVPAFLRQSKAEILAKFEDLEWQQQLRIAQGRTDPSSKWVQDVTAQVKLRNRYINVQPWEKSRIHLRVAEGKSDYINASPIVLHDPRSGTTNTYIAAQGPKKAGLSHFWHMIWQETNEVAVIVMLTQTAEAGREKCFQYFPQEADSSELRIEPLVDADESTVGHVKCEEIVVEETSRTTVRKLLLTIGKESRTVWHLLFCGWPDFSVPEGQDQAGLLELLRLSKEKNSVPNNPRIIHCSAGVGRSGTFIALEYLLIQLKSGAVAEAKDGEDMIYDVVNRLREQRMTMVQSDAQYLFLHQVLREQFDISQGTALTISGDGGLSSRLPRLTRGIISPMITSEDSGENRRGTPDEGKAPITL